MPGDVIIFRKNGGSDTPVIHRALFKAVENPNGGWDVPGTRYCSRGFNYRGIRLRLLSW